jgi:hypothetical protein
MATIRDLTGQKFGRLVVLEKTEKNKAGMWYWLCRCDCGNTCIIRGAYLKSGSTQSCGCYQKERTSETNKTHLLSKTPEYQTYNGMRRRCYSSKVKQYKDYGGRGIKVCDRWLEEKGFENFLLDMGPRPKGYQLDRINNDGNYEPSNCRWVTPTENCRNTSKNHFLTFGGVNKTIAEWEEELKIPSSVISHRLRAGFSLEKVFSLLNLRTGRPLKNLSAL